MLEKGIERKLVRAIKSFGGLCVKLGSYVGIPDRLCLIPGGRVIFVELKTERGKMGPGQGRWMTKLRKLGFDCRVLRGVAEVDAFIDELRTIARPKDSE